MTCRWWAFESEWGQTMTQRRGYTLVELAMVTCIVAILIAAAVAGNDSSKSVQASLAEQDFESDVAYARNLTISQPDDPIVIKADITANKYWLAKASAQDTPITNPQTGQPYVAQFGATGKSRYNAVSIAGFDFGGDAILKFDGTGATDQQTAAVIQFASGSAQFQVNVSTATAQTSVTPMYTTTITSGPGTGIAQVSAQ